VQARNIDHCGERQSSKQIRLIPQLSEPAHCKGSVGK